MLPIHPSIHQCIDTPYLSPHSGDLYPVPLLKEPSKPTLVFGPFIKGKAFSGSLLWSIPHGPLCTKGCRNGWTTRQGRLAAPSWGWVGREGKGISPPEPRSPCCCCFLYRLCVFLRYQVANAKPIQSPLSPPSEQELISLPSSALLPQP